MPHSIAGAGVLAALENRPFHRLVLDPALLLAQSEMMETPADREGVGIRPLFLVFPGPRESNCVRLASKHA